MEEKYIPISFEQVAERAENILFRYSIEDCPAKHIADIIEKEDIYFNEDEYFDPGIDGVYLIADDCNLIVVKKEFSNHGRRTFTIAHELGHHFLRHCMRGQILECKIMEGLEFDKKDEAIYKRKEQEANVFASNLLMPKNLVVPVVKEALKITDRLKHGSFYLDNQPTNINDWQKCCMSMRMHFKTSNEAIKWRLHRLGFVNGNLNLKLKDIRYWDEDVIENYLYGS